MQDVRLVPQVDNTTLQIINGILSVKNGAKIEIGSYVGNAGGPRDIAVGFTPTAVLIMGNVIGYYDYRIFSAFAGYSFSGGSNVFSSGGTLGANKFTVGNNKDSANASGETYHWIAFRDGG